MKTSLSQLAGVAELEHWLRTAEAGEELVYHVGLLMADRQGSSAVDDLARRVLWEGTFTRTVELVQKRVSEGVCEYIAVKRGGAAR